VRKLYLFLAKGMTALGLIAQGFPALVETSQPAAASPNQKGTAEKVFAASPNASRAKVAVNTLLEATPTTYPLMAQAATAAVSPAEPTTPMVTLKDSVTSVNQLSDVQPTDWAFQALQSLIKRYNVIAGYPGGTYQGNRTITRYEFATGLNTVLNRVNELIVAGMADKVSREDLVTLQRLRKEFAAELTTLQGRVDNLEARAAELEANQFSTTTKLSAILALGVSGGGFSGDRIIDPMGVEIADGSPNPTVFYRETLDLNTSFSGTDLLKVRVEVGSDHSNDNAAGYLEPTFGSVIDFSDKSATDGRFAITRANYTFTPFKDFKVTLGPVLSSQDYVDINRYANKGISDFSSQLFVNNLILFPLPGLSPGAVIDWKPGNGSFSVRAVYNAIDGANPNPDNQRVLNGVAPFARLLYPRVAGDRGLFGDPYQGTVELEYSAKAFALRLQYSGGNVYNGRFDVLGANFELALSNRLGIFGRYGYGSYDDTTFGNINPKYWMAGIALPDLFMPGALGGIAVGQPFIENAVGNATQTNIEAFYKFPVSDNIQLTPLLQVISNPANQSSNGTIVTGTLRTVFSF